MIRKEAEALYTSRRGHYIIGQALYKAIEVMELEEYQEHSNIADMKALMKHIFSDFYDFEQLRVH